MSTYLKHYPNLRTCPTIRRSCPTNYTIVNLPKHFRIWCLPCPKLNLFCTVVGRCLTSLCVVCWCTIVGRCLTSVCGVCCLFFRWNFLRCYFLHCFHFFCLPCFLCFVIICRRISIQIIQKQMLSYQFHVLNYSAYDINENLCFNFLGFRVLLCMHYNFT